VKFLQNKSVKKIFVFLLIIGGLLFARLILAADFGVDAVNNGLNGSLKTGDPRVIAARVINLLLGFLGLVALVLIIYSGYLWMTSAGNEDKVTQAKRILKNGVIGLLIILSSWAIATFLISQFYGATTPGPGPGGCTQGATIPCGCHGHLTCDNGSWSQLCEDEDPVEECVGPPISCNSNPDPYGECIPSTSRCGTGRYCDNSCLCQPQGGLGSSCSRTTPGCDADDTRCSEYLTCNPTSCLCDGPPVITGISPVGGFCVADPDEPCLADEDCAVSNDTCDLITPNGTVNNFITIFGKSFGTYSATSSRLIFMGSNNPRDGVQPAVLNSRCINSWYDDQIVVAVPQGVTTGPIKVINLNSLEDTTDNTFGPVLEDFTANHINRPGLCYLDPNQGNLGSDVNYQGINLSSSTAFFGNYQSNVQGLYSNFSSPQGFSGTSTTPNIKAGETGSFVERDISGFMQKSNYLRFIKGWELGSGPYIISFNPLAGRSGQYVTIRGVGFGGARGGNHVYFDNTEASYVFPAICANSVWKDNQIIVKVPEGLANGDYQIKIELGSTTITSENLQPNTFEASSTMSLKTSMCRINPERGPVATPVSIWGEYFGNFPGWGEVQFYNDPRSTTSPISRENDADKIETAVTPDASTGPVRVIKGTEWGNELNFIVGECTKDSDCGSQFCCPANTYKKGRCVDNQTECFIEIPNSVFEWGFSTELSTTTLPYDSCFGMAKYLGSCYQGATCPNSPGACSSPAVSHYDIVGSCDYSCGNTPGCTVLLPCTYDAALDKCKQNNKICDLPTAFSTTTPPISGIKTCNASGHWEIETRTSCPSGWTRNPGNRCVQNSPAGDCSLCASGLNCKSIDSVGRCVSNKLCNDADAKCYNNPLATSLGDCKIEVAPSCECCCRIGHDAEDCCAPLKCEGNCGSDTILPDTNTYGSCSGCGAIGNTQAEHDASCNCLGSASKFCDISVANPGGICVDCAQASGQENCGDHSSVCCFDSRRTATTTDDVCHGLNGGTVVNTNKPAPPNPVEGSNYGYCAYYNCTATTPAVCASTSPLIIGTFTSTSTCITDCPQGIGNDPCSHYTDPAHPSLCTVEPGCCYDGKNSKCITAIGNTIEGGTYDGYCAYYNCGIPPLEDPLVCNQTATTTGIYISTSTCVTSCPDPQGGAGLDCVYQNSTSTCNTSLCSYPGFSCLTASGTPATLSDCGTCCCQVGTNPDSCAVIAPTLHCQADRGSCTGSGRGLCCGCTSDSECGSLITTGCGSEGCCQARPEVVSTLPVASADNVCRNASIKITFNQSMDLTSFGSNILLLEERDYGNGVCPAGTFLTDNRAVEEMFFPKTKNIFARLWDSLSLTFGRLFGRVNDQALAALPPSPSKLYCGIPGTVSSEASGLQTSLIFSPSKLLSASTKYFVVVKGEETLNSKSGVLSFIKIGMYERGLNNGEVPPATVTFTPSANIIFNGHAYLNSYSFQFTTLSNQGANAGICAVDHVNISPASYLFKTTTDDLNENDANAGDASFDTAADGDKVFTAGAYSVNNQLLNSVTGYAWNWDWVINNSAIVTTSTAPELPVTGLPLNRRFVKAQTGVTDGQTKINATINMDSFNSALGCGSNCNAYLIGDDETKASDVYVFICNNPWPAVNTLTGEWSPWVDEENNCSATGTCGDFDYKFYYCRDSGASGTLDDLPAILSSPISNPEANNNSNLLCSYDRKPCTVINTRCGADSNGDGQADGICYWNVLKESYFFREQILSGGNITNATSTGISGEVKIEWNSPASGVGSYKIYYLKSGIGTMFSKEVGTSTACILAQPPLSQYNCSTTINNLIDDQSYVFQLSVISTNKTESVLSSGKTATPKNLSEPTVPHGLTATLATTTVKFDWDPNPSTDNVVFYRLYRGIASGLFGESFDSAEHATSMTFNRSQFASTTSFFALSAINTSNHEGNKSLQVTVTFP